MQSASTVNEKAAGRLIPGGLQTPTQPPRRLVDTSKMLAAPAPNPKTGAAATRRGAHTIPACVASCQRLADRYSSTRCAIFRTLLPSSTSGIPAMLVSTETIAANAAEDAASAQSTPPSAVLAPITATAACAAVLSALTPAHRAHCNTSSFIITPYSTSAPFLSTLTAVFIRQSAPNAYHLPPISLQQFATA